LSESELAGTECEVALAEVFECVDSGSDKASEVRIRRRSVDVENGENVRLTKKENNER
jgi:hypothetical protein